MHMVKSHGRHLAFQTFNTIAECRAIIGRGGDPEFEKGAIRWLIDQARQDRIKGVQYPLLP